MAKTTKNKRAVKRVVGKKFGDSDFVLPEEYKAREAMLFSMLVNDADGKMSERMRFLMEKTGMSKSGLYKMAKNNNWESRLQAELKDKELLEHSDSVLKANAAYVTEELPSFEDIAKDIRSFASLAIKATKSSVFMAAKMMMYWNARMDALVESRGGVSFLTETDNIRMKTYEDRILYYQNLVSEYLKPSAVAKYLTIIGMKESLQLVPDGNELGTLTPAALCKMLEEMGVSAKIGDMTSVEAVEAEIEEMGVDVPDLNGIVGHAKKNGAEAAD